MEKSGNLPENLCLTPFAYLTFDPDMNVSPCPALGGSLWNFNGKSLNEVWTSDTLVQFRGKMLNNEKHQPCHRCWNEEAVGMASERTMLWDPATDPDGTKTKLLNSGLGPADILSNNRYLASPMQIVIKVGNVCNLRCRSCNSIDSVTLRVEGEHYLKKYGLKNDAYLKSSTSKVKSFTDQQIDEIANFTDNVVRIEFYGGEPLLDKQLPVLLGKIIDRGRASEINLNISTNITHRMNADLTNKLSEFGHVNINLSFDGWGDKFTYLRHPAEWATVYDNMKWFVKLSKLGKIKMSLLPVITVTSMNVYYLPELITNLHNEFRLTPFLILAWWPEHYSIRHIPRSVSDEIVKKLDGFELHDLTPIIEALRASGHDTHWKSFKVWNKIIDEYRGESFEQTFPEYAALIKKHDGDFYA